MEEIYIKVNDENVKLPPLTLALSEQMDSAQKAEGVREKAKAMYGWLQQVIPAKTLGSRLGGATLDELDCVALDVLFTQTVNAYQAPALNARAKAANEQVQAIKPLLDVMKRRGFKSVK